MSKVWFFSARVFILHFLGFSTFRGVVYGGEDLHRCPGGFLRWEF